MFHTNTLCRPGEYELLFPVLVVQIGNDTAYKELPENGTVLMKFDIPEVGSYNIYVSVLYRSLVDCLSIIG